MGVLVAGSAFALDPGKAMSQYIHDRWGADGGFLGGTIYAISQSADGYLWIGTERGLVRFDGFEFTLIQRPIAGAPSLGPVRGLVSDKDGNMWVRIDGPRLLVYRDGRFEDALAKFGITVSTVTAMSHDKDGALILAGVGNHTLHYVHGVFETIAGADEAPGTVLSMAQTTEGGVWMGTRDNGLFRVRQGSMYRVSTQLVDAKINTLLATDHNGLWIGTDNGIYLWDGGRFADPGLPAAIKQLPIMSMSRDRESNLWVGTGRGLIRINSGGASVLAADEQSPGNDIAAVYEDREGNLWFGGSHGLERLRDGMFTTYATSEGLPAEVSGPVYSDADGRTWFAPAAGGLYSLWHGHVARVSIAGLEQDVVYSISGGNGEVWVGRQRGGLTVLNGAGHALTARTYTHADGMVQDGVYSVHRNRDGTVWAGTLSGGVSRLSNGVFTNYSVGNGLVSNFIASIVEGYDGKMWFATPGGLECFADGKWSNRSAKDGLPSSDVRSIFEDSKHVLWIATAGGLALLAGGHISVPQVLPDALREQIFGFAEDRSGFLWIATTDHVLQVDRDRLFSGAFDVSDIRSYGTADGLQEVGAIRRDRSVASDSLGRVWFSREHGLAVADPALILRNAASVEVRIESIWASNTPINLQGTPKIAAGNQTVTLNYVGTSLSVPEKVVFRYKLNSEKGWSEIVRMRQVVYKNLDPGTYHWRAVASNSLGLWNGRETTFSFVIEPAVWQTWWFRVLCLSAIALVMVALYRLRMYQLTQRLDALFQERLAERTRIAQDLHDTLLQGVLSASMQLDVAQDQLPESSPAQPVLNRVLELMRQVTDEGRSALQGLRSKDQETTHLEVSFSRLGQELSVNDRIAYSVVTVGAARPIRPVIRDEIYRIGREAVTNAFLHAQANVVELEVEYANKYLRVLVRDDGCGIDSQVLVSGRAGHWGLIGMRERSERIGGSLKLLSRVGAGTEIELTVPAAIAFEDQIKGPVSRCLSWVRREKSSLGGQRRKKGRLR